MESRAVQILSFSAITIAMAAASFTSLPDASAHYFYPLIVSRLVLSLSAFVLLLFILSEKGKTLPEGTVSLLFLIVALIESFLAYLQANVTGLSYAILSICLSLSSAISFLTLRTSLLSLLPSQLTILSAPLLSLPLSVWSDRVLATNALLMPAATLISSAAIWLLNSVYVHRKTIGAKVKNMQRRQEILQAQLLLLRKQPESLKKIFIQETVRDRAIDQHAAKQHQTVSDQVLLSDLVLILRESVTAAQARLGGKRAMRMALDLPAPMSLPIAIAAERNDLKNILTSALNKSIASLNNDQGVIRVSARVGYKGVSIVIEDNGWGLREKFSASSSLSQQTQLELSLREIQGMVSFWGGRLEVLSRLGVGSRMNIELVRVDAFATEPVSTQENADSLQERVNDLKADATSQSTTGS